MSLATETIDENIKTVLSVFFDDPDAMQRSIAILCESNFKQQADPVTQTILTMLGSSIHIQLTAVGWQPFKGKELTYPFAQMTLPQRQSLKSLLGEGCKGWVVYEHAMLLRRNHLNIVLQPLQVLGALCASVLKSTVYSDKKIRMVICNILLQRVQASIPIERGIQSELNTLLFPPTPSQSPKMECSVAGPKPGC
jgi:hypothetical protein